MITTSEPFTNKKSIDEWETISSKKKIPNILPKIVPKIELKNTSI